MNKCLSGDIIYVKGTGTAYEPFKIKKPGLDIIGYSVSPEDLDGGSSFPTTYSESKFAASTPFIPGYPVIDGGNRNRQAGQTLGIDLNGKQVRIDNFFITGVGSGVGSTHTVSVKSSNFRNIFVFNVGRTFSAGSQVITGDVGTVQIPGNPPATIGQISFCTTGNSFSMPLENFVNLGIKINDHSNKITAYSYDAATDTHKFTLAVTPASQITDGEFTISWGDPFTGYGFEIGSDYEADFVSSVYLENCTVYNSSYAGFELKRSHNCNIQYCSVFADDNSTGWDSACDYYFLIAGGHSNTVTDCIAERYPDVSTGQPLLHPGHGFIITAQPSQSLFNATNNRFLNCSARNLADVCLLRGIGTHGNLYEDIRSVVDLALEQEVGDNETPFGVPKALGCIQLSNGPYENVFNRIHLVNSDVAVELNMSAKLDDTPAMREFGFNTAEGNVFANCIFHCESAIRCSDVDDAIGPYQVDGQTFGGTLAAAAGTEFDIVDNLFVHCTFLADLELDSDNQNSFFQAAREASGNQLVNCVIAGFETYMSYSYLQPANRTATALTYVQFPWNGDATIRGFTIRNSCIFNLDSSNNELFSSFYSHSSLENEYGTNPDFVYLSDPEFVGVPFPDFDSPLKDVATESFSVPALLDMTLDCVGNPRKHGTARDIGAVEWFIHPSLLP